MMVVQYRGKENLIFANKGRNKVRENLFFFKTRKLKTCLPSLKYFSLDLKSKNVHKIFRAGCNSTFVGQVVRHLTTRNDEHRRENSSVGQHLRQYGNDGTSAGMSWEVVDQANTNVRLLTLEELHIQKERPSINTRDGIRSRELTL